MPCFRRCRGVSSGLGFRFRYDKFTLLRKQTSLWARWVVAATPSGYRWDDTSFQAYYHKQTHKALHTYPECQALFVGLLATGAAKLRKDEESFVLFRQASRLIWIITGAAVTLAVSAIWQRIFGA